MKLSQCVSLPLVLAAFSIALAQSTATDSKPAKPAASEPAKSTKARTTAKPDWYPFHGTVKAVNTKAGTVSLNKEDGERVLQLDGKSRLSHLGKPATLSDVKVGEYAHGKLHKNAKGEEVITAAKFDTDAPTADPKKAKAKNVESSKEQPEASHGK